MRRSAALLTIALGIVLSPSAQADGPVISEPTVAGATVRTPDSADRTMHAAHAEAFVRAWLGTYVLGTPAEAEPPADAAVRARVSVRMLMPDGTERQMVIDYASSGEDAWVRMPAQDLGWGRVDRPIWIAAPDGTAAAFERAPQVVEPTAAASSRGGHPAGIAAAAAILLATFAVLVRRRRRLAPAV